MKKQHYLISIGAAFCIMVLWSCTNAVSKKQETDDLNHEQKESYQPNWESLSRHEAAPEWFRDAKLGIYFHWGPYSVPAYGSAWYPRNMHMENHEVRKFHEENFGPITEFGYEDFIPMFTGEFFDPEEWADLFQRSGAQFAGPVAQHHDGFAMWHSDINPWNARDMGPKRDILGQLFESLRERNMKTIATFHHARNGQRNAQKPENWKVGYDSHYPYHPDLPTSTTDPKLRKLFGNFETIGQFNDHWRDQINEVVDKYDPDIIWFDSWLNIIPEKYRQEMAAHFFNKSLKSGKEVVICHKQEDMPMSLSVLDFEQGGRREINPMPWMTDITLGKRRWMYVEGHPNKDAALVIRNMIDVWSKNGIVLLNVSPKANGVIPDGQRKVLRQIGDWLTIHGEAVYGTRPFSIFGYGQAKASAGLHGGQSATTAFTQADVRFTLSKDKKALYAFFLGAPEPGQKIEMRKLGIHRYPTPSAVKRVVLLGSGEEAQWELTTETCYLTMPNVEMNELATVFKFELE